MERGFWSASAGEPPEVPPHFTSGQISFPVPLVVPRGEANVHYINPTIRAELETNATKTVPGCKTATTETIHPLIKPVAEVSGNLCVYAGFEELANEHFVAIVNLENNPGASRTGAAVLYEYITAEFSPEETRIHASGTWAVKG
jgi:hypothetical protein